MRGLSAIVVPVILEVVILEVILWFVKRLTGKLSGVAFLILNPQLSSLELISIVFL